MGLIVPFFLLCGIIKIGDNMKKGFTLIELLAVIVILAVIALIATPIIINIINDTRIESQKRSIDNYAKALENELVRSQMYSNNAVNIDTAIENMTYNGSRVNCETRKIQSNGTIYLDNCSVDGNLVENYSYGQKKNETTPMILTGTTANNKITGYTLDKTGNIGLDIYANISGDSHLTYSINGSSEIRVNSKKDKEGKVYYTVPVSPKNIAYSISMKLYSGDTEVDTLTTSVKEYCNSILGNSSYEDSHELMKAIVTYGRHAQEYFNVNTSDLADSILSTPIDLATIDLHGDYINTLPYLVTSGVRTDFSINPITFSMDSVFGVKMYIVLKNNATIDNFSFTFQGKPINYIQSGSQYVLDMSYGYLNASNKYTYTFKNGNDVFVLEEAPLARMFKNYENPGYTSGKNLIAAFIYYYFTANSYYFN